MFFWQFFTVDWLSQKNSCLWWFLQDLTLTQCPREILLEQWSSRDTQGNFIFVLASGGQVKERKLPYYGEGDSDILSDCSVPSQVLVTLYPLFQFHKKAWQGVIQFVPVLRVRQVRLRTLVSPAFGHLAHYCLAELGLEPSCFSSFIPFIFNLQRVS